MINPTTCPKPEPSRRRDSQQYSDSEERAIEVEALTRARAKVSAPVALAEVQAKVHAVAYSGVLADSRRMGIIYSTEPSHRHRHARDLCLCQQKDIPHLTPGCRIRGRGPRTSEEGGLCGLVAVAGLLPTAHSSNVPRKISYARCCGVRTSVDRYSDREQRV